jgi:hypothetical protein
MGRPWTDTVTWGTVSTERGIKIVSIPEDLVVNGMEGVYGNAITDTDCLYVRCYEDGAAPGSGNIYSGFNGGSQYSIGTKVRYTYSHLELPDTRLRKGHTYRFTFAGNGTGTFAAPNYGTITDATAGFSHFMLCAHGKGIVHYATADDGAGGWTDYDTSSDVRQMCMALVVKERCSIPRALVGIR